MSDYKEGITWRHVDKKCLQHNCFPVTEMHLVCVLLLELALHFTFNLTLGLGGKT